MKTLKSLWKYRAVLPELCDLLREAAESVNRSRRKVGEVVV